MSNPSDRIFAELDQAIATAAEGDRPSLVVALAARLAAVGARLAISTAPSMPAVEDDRNVSIIEGARRLGLSPSYLYRNAAKLPFCVREGRRILVNLTAVAAYNRRRSAR